MVCQWKRCRTTVKGLFYCDVSLCLQHWLMVQRWVTRLEEAGPRLTLRQVAILLERSTKNIRSKRCQHSTP